MERNSETHFEVILWRQAQRSAARLKRETRLDVAAILNAAGDAVNALVRLGIIYLVVTLELCVRFLKIVRVNLERKQ